MGLIYKLCFLCVLLFVSSYSFSGNPYDNLNPSGDGTEALFDYSYGLAPDETGSLMTGETPTIQVAAASCSEQEESLESNAGPLVEYSSFSCSFETQEENLKVLWTLTYCKKVYWSEGGPIKTDACGYIATGFEQGTLEIVDVCPPQGYSNYIISAFVGDAQYCFDFQDIAERDSCSPSGLNGETFIAIGSNTNDSVCKLEDDGSYCDYVKHVSGDYYTSANTQFCYVNSDIEQYVPIEAPEIDGETDECQDIGFGVPTCIEDPSNVCDSNGICDEGCGTIETSSGSEFVCLSGDTDDDGIPDYLDPDKDNDGIPNEDDLDADGDGVDDLDFDSTGGIADLLTTANEIADDARNGIGSLNSGIGTANQTLSSILTELQNGSGTGSEGTSVGGDMPVFSDTQDEVEFNQALLARYQNTDIVLAMESMKTFINFGSGDACPVFSFDLPPPINSTAGTTVHCDMMPSISSIISPVMLAIYVFMGFRIFTSA